MYAYLFLALVILGIFSFVENIKGGQKISFIKLNFLILLFCVTLNSLIDFSIEFGYNASLYGSIVRPFTMIFVVYLFYFVASNKLPKIILYIEILFIISYLLVVMSGYRFMTVYEGRYSNGLNLITIINMLAVYPLMIISMLYNIYKINQSTDHTNLYQVRAKKWTIFIFILCFILLVSVVATIALYFKTINSSRVDTRLILFAFRLGIILFIFFRPKFIDEERLPLKLNSIIPKNKNTLLANFEFLFYGNQYYLNPEANLNDFAMKLNHSKAEVVEFLQHHTNENFLELLNKNRVLYFKELLRSKRYQSFTIEALSEISGFNNRQTMYNAFNKYEGCSPSDYIDNL